MVISAGLPTSPGTCLLEDAGYLLSRHQHSLSGNHCTWPCCQHSTEQSAFTFNGKTLKKLRSKYRQNTSKEGKRPLQCRFVSHAVLCNFKEAAHDANIVSPFTLGFIIKAVVKILQHRQTRSRFVIQTPNETCPSFAVVSFLDAKRFLQEI